MKTEGICRIPNSVAKLPLKREKLIEMVVEFSRKQGCVSFSVGTFWKRHGDGFEHRDVEKVLEHLYSQKKLVRLNDGRFLTVEALNEIREKVRALILRKGGLTIQDAKDVLGYGRNRAVPVLDYLDSTGFTQRVGQERHLCPEDHAKRSVRG